MITSAALCYLNYIVFWSCSRAWKKHKLWYKPGDDFFHILLFMHGHGRGAHLGTCLVQQQCVSYIITVQHVSMFQFPGWARACMSMRLGTRLVYATCGVAFVASVSGAGWRCPKTLYAHKQCTRAL